MPISDSEEMLVNSFIVLSSSRDFSETILEILSTKESIADILFFL